MDAAFITAGFTAEQAGEAYTGFYSILGEEDRSVEAVNHLAKLYYIYSIWDAAAYIADYFNAAILLVFSVCKI